MQCLLPRDLLVEATGIASWRIMILEVAIEKLSCIMPTLDSDSKESPCNVGDPGLIPGLGRSTREGKSHGQRSLVGYSLWGYKESDMTEQLTLIRIKGLCLAHIPWEVITQRHKCRRGIIGSHFGSCLPSKQS